MVRCAQRRTVKLALFDRRLSYRPNTPLDPRPWLVQRLRPRRRSPLIHILNVHKFSQVIATRSFLLQRVSLPAGNRLPMGSVALVAYEYVITFEQEVRFIWSQRKTGASLLFFVIRYYALVTLVFIQAISYMPMSSPM
ncbi:hypothetical protein C8Q70DRAFT_689383 [Cubamyces menziesii]|nr:hypothetical protein C8Q70DRAFT_689383 [Cubamyces menziesii]